MSDTDLGQPDLAPLRAAAEAAEFAEPEPRLATLRVPLATATRWHCSPATSPARSPRRA